MLKVVLLSSVLWGELELQVLLYEWIHFGNVLTHNTICIVAVAHVVHPVNERKHTVDY